MGADQKTFSHVVSASERDQAGRALQPLWCRAGRSRKDEKVYLDFERWWEEHTSSFKGQLREQIAMISNDGIEMKE